jgi:Putative adhesin
MRLIGLAFIATVSIVLPFTAQADSCEFSAERSTGADMDGVTKVVLTTGAGDLKVRGVTGARRAEASGKACASSDELLKKIVLQTRREGSVLYVETIMPELQSAFFGSTYASVDLNVTLPNNAPLEAQDSSGDSDLRDLKSLKMLDSSGDLAIDNIGEAVTLQDSSGDVRITKVRGNVEITSDSSGDLKIEEVAGNVHIAQDSSGEIRVTKIRGSVKVDSDTSGGITVRDIEGDFEVGADTSGGVSVDNVRGRVTTP